MRYEHYDNPRDVKYRLGGYQETAVCRCAPCVAAGVEEPPILVPSDRMLPSGEYVSTGRWLHGRELLEHLEARRVFEAAMKSCGKVAA
jgi:hypothetical protein